ALWCVLGNEGGGLLSEDDLMAAADELEPNSSAALLVWEDVWATKLRDAIVNAGGALWAPGRVARGAVRRGGRAVGRGGGRRRGRPGRGRFRLVQLEDHCQRHGRNGDRTMMRRGPGLVGMAARTAVVAGTATAVSGRVGRRQANRYAEQDAQYTQQQVAAVEAGSAQAMP